MPTPDQQLLIRFGEIRVVKLNMTAPENQLERSEELETQLDFDPVFYDNKDKEFDVVFSIKIKNSDSSFLMESKALARFLTSNVITDEFKKSSFAKISAPAIAFPYLRAYISTVTLNSGIHPVVLPAYNFTDIKVENENKSLK
jgi:preprotein translocase subunit SecB